MTCSESTETFDLELSLSSKRQEQNNRRYELFGIVRIMYGHGHQEMQVILRTFVIRTTNLEKNTSFSSY